MNKRNFILKAIKKKIEHYGKNNRLKEPNLTTLKEKDELRLLKWQHGVRVFPPKRKYFMYNFLETPDAELHKKVPFLWVILKDKIKIVNEQANFAKRLKLKKMKHTNMTGGSKAYGGGEMWFIGNKDIVVNGCSGRYGPNSEDELNNLVDIIKASGWHIKSLGWDSEIGRPVKFPRGAK